MPDAKEAEIAFDKLSAHIHERQAFELAHPVPPYTTYKTDIHYPDVDEIRYYIMPLRWVISIK